MNILSVGLSFSLVCCLSGFKEENIFLDKEFVHLEALPLDKLLKINQELRKKDNYRPQPPPPPSSSSSSARRTAVTAENAADGRPNAMALQRRAESVMPGSLAGSSMRTAFQMSLTVLSFLAFGGYVIGMVAQNMQNMQNRNGGGLTPPRPLRTVIVNQSARQPLRPTTAVAFGRRKPNRKSV